MKKFEELLDITLDDAVRHLQKAINYGDYLAEQKKQTELELLHKKELMREQKLVGQHQATGSDAKKRELEAEHYAKTSVHDYDAKAIESAFVTDLFKNNHDRIEALRTLISARKATNESYVRNAIN